MNNQKHQKFIDEMMVVFSGKGDAGAAPVEEQPVAEPEYTANDVFTNATNDLIKNFSAIGQDTGIDTVPAEPMTHVMTVGDESVDDDTANANDNSVDDISEPADDQIVFDMVDGDLQIKFAGTELHLGADAVKKLKDYLNSKESETTEEDKAEDESDDETDDKTSVAESKSNDKDIEKSKKCKCGANMKYSSRSKTWKCPKCRAREKTASKIYG